MAKKNTPEEKKKIDLFGLIQKVDNSVEILSKSAYSVIKDWIPSGNYILNACMSGDLFKAVPSGRITVLAGESQTGKSYLACSICREAQKRGYTPVYLDSENAIDKDFVTRLGCDPDNFLIKQVSTIKETSTFIANLCKDLQEQVDNGAEVPKIIIVIDSLGQLTSDKERNDTLSGNTAADFTKAKDIKAMFRVNTIPLAKLQIPLLCTNHVVANIGSFVSATAMSGGCLHPDEEVQTIKGNKKIKDIQDGDFVLSHDNNFHEVLKIWNFEKETLEFEFEDGKTIKCSENHRFLIDKEHPELETSWKFAKDLIENDEIYSLAE